MRFDGQTVKELRCVPIEQPLSVSELSAASQIRVGDAFQSGNAAATIDKLFATGAYTDIQVDVQPVSGGVSVQLITESQLFTGHISIVGDVGRSPTPGELVEASRLRLGEPFQEEDVREAEQRLRRILNNNGLYAHELRSEYVDKPNIQQRDVRFIVDTGPRAPGMAM